MQSLTNCRERLRLRYSQAASLARRGGVSAACVLDVLSLACLLCGTGLALYIRGPDAYLLFGISGASLALFALFVALRGYAALSPARPILLHLWLGYFLGLGCFHAAGGGGVTSTAAGTSVGADEEAAAVTKHERSESVEQATIWLMLLSVCAGLLHIVFTRVVYPLMASSPAGGAEASAAATASSHRGGLLTRSELWEQVGLTISLLEQPHWWELSLLNACLALTAILLRLRSWLAVINGLFLAAACVYLQHSLRLHYSLAPLLVYMYRQLSGSIIDNGASVVEIWWPVWRRWFLHHPAYAVLLCADVAALAVGASVVVQHPQHVLMLPFYAVAACPFVAFHAARLLLLHQFTGRLCRLHSPGDSAPSAQSAPSLLAARGLRYLSQLGCRLLWLSLLSSGLLACLTWETRSPASLSLLALCISCDAVLLATCTRLTECIGGTCLAYGLVSPELPAGGGGIGIGGVGGGRADSVVLHSPGAHREQLSRCTRQLDSVQCFFSSHLLTSFGCDLNSSGLSRDLVQQKLRQFFRHRTPDQQRYDTYLVYYCGPTDPQQQGAWAFTGGACLSLDGLLQLWREAAAEDSDERDCRLVLIVDSTAAWRWLPAVRCLPRNACVAMQTHSGLMQDFTRLFTSSGGLSAAPSSTEAGDAGELLPTTVKSAAKLQQQLGLRYAVSPGWVDFKLTQPTQASARQFWEAALPASCRCLLPALTASCPLPRPRIVSPFCNACKRLRMRICPPASLDTGLGFRLAYM